MVGLLNPARPLSQTAATKAAGFDCKSIAASSLFNVILIQVHRFSKVYFLVEGEIVGSAIAGASGPIEFPDPQDESQLIQSNEGDIGHKR